MTSSDSISSHERADDDCRHEFGPVIACEDDRHDDSTICQTVDQLTGQSGSAELVGLGWYVTSWRCDRKWVATFNNTFHYCGQTSLVSTSTFKSWSCHPTPSIWCSHFMWKLSRILISAARQVRVSAAYIRMERTSAWGLYVRILMGSDEWRSLRIFFRKANTEEAKAMRILIFDRQWPSEHQILLRYRKLCTWSTVLLRWCRMVSSPQQHYCSFVFGQKVRKPRVEAALLKEDRQVAVAVGDWSSQAGSSEFLSTELH